MCPHESWTGVGRIEREAKRIRFVMVCDDCGAEQAELWAGPYEPRRTDIPEELLARERGAAHRAAAAL
jgi:hypothetical protein